MLDIREKPTNLPCDRMGEKSIGRLKAQLAFCKFLGVVVANARGDHADRVLGHNVQGQAHHASQPVAEAPIRTRAPYIDGDEGRNEIKSRTFFKKTAEQAPAPSRARNDRPITRNYRRGRMTISLNQTTCPWFWKPMRPLRGRSLRAFLNLFAEPSGFFPGTFQSSRFTEKHLPSLR